MANIHYKNKIFKVEECLSRSGEIRCNYFKTVAELIDSWIKGRQNFEIRTSGSTGMPKTINFTREQCIKSAQQTIDIFGLQKGDNFLCCLDISYVAGFMMIIRALIAEANIYLTKAERNPLLKTEKRTKLDFAAFVPYQLQSILEDSAEGISRLNYMKAILVGGGTISTKVAERIMTIKAPVYHTYGMTETLTHVALKQINSAQPDTNFKALPEVSFSKDDRGCLIIKTPIVAEEIYTNDIVELISPTEFSYLGRFDQVINSGGFKIHPEAVEQIIAPVITELFQSDSFFIFAADDDKFGQHPELIIQGTPDKENLIRLQSTLKRILHPYELPKKIHFSKSFDYTRTGKVNRIKTISNTLN